MVLPLRFNRVSRRGTADVRHPSRMRLRRARSIGGYGAAVRLELVVGQAGAAAHGEHHLGAVLVRGSVDPLGDAPGFESHAAIMRDAPAPGITRNGRVPAARLVSAVSPRAPPARTRRTPPVRRRSPAGNRTARTSG